MEESDSAKGESSKVITKKMYYLSCLACRWTSRDVGIPDQVVGGLILKIYTLYSSKLLLFLIESNWSVA